jgi:hypothetical protein
MTPIFAILDHPRDYPQFFVVRLWLSDRPTNLVSLHKTLEEARASLPKGLTRMPHMADEDPVIIESWLGISE